MGQKFVLKQTGFNQSNHLFSKGSHLGYLDQFQKANELLFDAPMFLSSLPAIVLSQYPIVSNAYINLTTFFDSKRNRLIVINNNRIISTSFTGESHTTPRILSFNYIVNQSDKGYIYDDTSATLGVIDQNFLLRTYQFNNDNVSIVRQTLNVSFLNGTQSFTLVCLNNRAFIFYTDSNGNLNYREVITGSQLSLGSQYNLNVNLGNGSKIKFQTHTKYLLVVTPSGELSTYFINLF